MPRITSYNVCYTKLLRKVDKRRDARLVDALVQETELGPEALKKVDFLAERGRLESFLQSYHPDALPLEIVALEDREHQARRWSFTTQQVGTERTSISYNFV